MAGRLTVQGTLAATATDGAASNADDLTLAHRAATDADAFALLYERYVDRVHAFCYRRLQSREAAEDTTSQTFVKLLTAIRRKPPRSGSVKAWIFTIAWHVLIDGHRTAHPHTQIDSYPELPAPEPSLDDVVIAGEVNATVDRLIAQLPGDGPAIVQLRLAGLTDREIAQVLGKSHGAIRTAQHRAFIRLRDIAAQTGVEP